MTLLAQASARSASPPVRARPEATFQWEAFSQAFREIAPLTFANWNESGGFEKKLPFDPDWDRYFDFERTGILHVLTARVGGELAGYVACLVLPHIEHSTALCASVKTIFMAKEHRAGTLAIRLLKRALSDLSGKGVTIFTVADKGHRDGAFGEILKRMGFVVDETIYAKVVK